MARIIERIRIKGALPMELDFRSFAFIITLAAVINALGMVRWLTAFAEYLRKRQSIRVDFYWVFVLAAAFQFLLHILLWWSLWNARQAETFNFLTYLYMLTGPVLLYLGTSLLVPDVDNNGVDLKEHYFRVRTSYTTVLILLYLWAIFLWPLLVGAFAPTVKILAIFAAVAFVMRVSDKPVVHKVAVILNWLLLVIFIAGFAMRLGGVGESMVQ